MFHFELSFLQIQYPANHHSLHLHNDYLKWICGFANAKGGKLLIGVDDAGSVIGINNATKLLEQLPNKFRDILGVFADVNLHEFEGKNHI